MWQCIITVLHCDPQHSSLGRYLAIQSTDFHNLECGNRWIDQRPVQSAANVGGLRSLVYASIETPPSRSLREGERQVKITTNGMRVRHRQ